MSQFILCIAINNTNAEKQSQLNTALYNRKIYRVINVGNEWKDLPQGTYVHYSELTCSDIELLAIAALNEIGIHNNPLDRNFEIITAQAPITVSDLKLNIDPSKRPVL